MGGAVRDELLGRDVVDLDVACPIPNARRASTRAPPAGLSSRSPNGTARGASRSAPARRLHSATRRDRGGSRFARFRDQRHRPPRRRRRRRRSARRSRRPGGTGAPGRLVRRSSSTIRCGLRAVRLEDELGFRLDEGTERLVREHAGLATKPAGERILGELERLSPEGFRRAEELGVLGPLGGSTEKLEREGDDPSPALRLALVFEDGSSGFRSPTSSSASCAP